MATPGIFVGNFVANFVEKPQQIDKGARQSFRQSLGMPELLIAHCSFCIGPGSGGLGFLLQFRLVPRSLVEKLLDESTKLGQMAEISLKPQEMRAVLLPPIRTK